MSAEVLIAAGYSAGLIAGAFLLEWLSAHTHRRALRYRTAGFAYDPAHDHWQCPEGEYLWPREFDRERRLVRYRAKAHVCNACPRKGDCTDSDRGREIARPVDPWPHSEAGRFHRAIAVLMVVLGAFIVTAEIVRHHRPGEAALLVSLFVVAVLAGRWLARDLARHPANFPEPSPSQGLGLVVTDAGGRRAQPPRAG